MSEVTQPRPGAPAGAPPPDGGAPGRVVPLISVVVPTRNEEGNVAPLCSRLEAVLPGEALEVIFVDDSDDGTGDEVRRVAATCKRPIRLVERPPERRGDGLGGAVVDGMRIARGAWVCVMDGDLQHPPELVGRMLEQARTDGLDLVVASRYDATGDSDGLGRVRRAASWLCTQGARMLFPGRLRAVSDPMSGFFLVLRDAVDLDRLRPRGFKILVEIIARTPGLRVGEVGFHFGRRLSGESKAGVREAVRLGRQLVSARVGGRPARLARFGLVGASGLVVNTAALALFTELGHLYYGLGAILATQASTAWNFALTERWVFRGQGAPRGMPRRAVLFFATNNTAMLVRIPLLLLLTDGIGIQYLVSNVLSLLALTLVRFLLADAWIWRAPHRAAGGRATAWDYDIHGILTVESDVRLPELERFRVEELVEHPSIAVTTRRPAPTSAPAAAGGDVARLSYTESLRRLGFAVDIAIGDRVEVRASRLLALSPHVLYTNVVEPILRWRFAERGYALVHAACISDGDRALLVTARTDTGKTTTCLKALDAAPYAFLSDDLTLLCPDGRVLAYPKPMTISRHTLHAVHAPRLGRRERAALVLQSRLHSRSGRRFALLLARTHLPAATINAITQLIVPPPKYDVDRLIPGVRIAAEAKVHAMAIIQRGGVGEERLSGPDALATLLENCEDAYGFPPYPTIEHFLHSRGGARLKEVERAIVERALHGVDATLLRSETMDWASRLGAVLGVAPQHVPAPAGAPHVGPVLEAVVPGTAADG
jgi:dolichol-phosphate mannosyltransferase